MIFRIISGIFLAGLCLISDKELKKATVEKDLHNQIKYGVYLIIGIMALLR